MNRTLWIGASGMSAQQMNLDTIAHDLANVNTVGHKRSRAEFAELFSQYQKMPGESLDAETIAPVGVSVGLGSRPTAVRRDHSQGPLQETGGKLDMAIVGEGFFIVEMPNGDQGFTRAGTFQTDGEGRIVDSEGRPVEGDFTVPDETRHVAIGEDGTLSVLVDGDEQPQVLGQLQLARFINPQGLESLGGGLYRPTEASGDAEIGNAGEEGRGRLRQGFVESSNVSVVEEMVNMITAQRAYEINARAVSAADSMLQVLNEVLR